MRRNIHFNEQEIDPNQATGPYMISKLAHSQGDEDLVLSFDGILQIQRVFEESINPRSSVRDG